MNNLPTSYTGQNHPVSKREWSFSMPSAQEMDHLIKFCQVMANSPFYNKMGAGGVMAIYLTAKEYNLPFMACMNGGLHTFDGKVTFSAIMISALIIDAGHTADIIYLNETGCKIVFTRGDRKNDPEYKPFELEYTLEQARIAGYLSKTNWKTSPKDMLWARCLLGGARKHMSEVVVGVLCAGELVGSDSDSEAPAYSPPSLNKENAVIAVTPVMQIEDQRAEGFDEFVSKHGLLANSDGTCSDKLEYIRVTANKVNKTELQIINSAIKNEKLFEDRFLVWKEKKDESPKK